MATSSQDEFAKWAKIRRTLDSRNAELDALSCVFSPVPSYPLPPEGFRGVSWYGSMWLTTEIDGKISSARTAFDAKASTLRWITTTGLRIILQFWFSKRPMFWIPEGWVPGYVEWGLSFPRAPKGSVSIQVWAFAVGQVVSLTFAITVLMWEKLRGAGTVDGAMKAGGKEEEAKKKV